MYTGLLHTHSLLRYFVLLMLLVVIITALVKSAGRKPYSSLDNKLSLYLLIFTHLQLLVGVVLYFVSPAVQFTGYTMKEKMIRYWTVEHLTLMLIAIAVITVARVSLKKISDDARKHRRTWLFNGLALVIIILAISMSGRGILHPDLF
ncbi:MAG: cytochrome B [Cyclobacteriaceae bacterium]|nr:cytochrome B [Cyclobacteriaceae bacterium]MDW8331716.1 cytochrome B [Cyclobacteriaceae bacterium]